MLRQRPRSRLHCDEHRFDGVITLFEKYRGRKVHWSVCLLHTNELPLRHLFEKFDGPTSGKTFFQSWHAHMENLLVSLLCSDVREERNFAVEKMLALRDGRDEGVSSPRRTDPPKLNLDASNKAELIGWNNVKLPEPILTSHMGIDEIEAVRETKLEIPHFPSHTQSVERLIRELTQACSRVAETEARDGLIRTRLASRATYSKKGHQARFHTNDFVS